MTPQEFEESNIRFNSLEEGIDSIDAWIGDSPGPVPDSFLPTIITCWKPSPEEIQQIIKTGKIWIWFFSDELPPHSITAFSPFELPIDPLRN